MTQHTPQVTQVASPQQLGAHEDLLERDGDGDGEVQVPVVVIVVVQRRRARRRRRRGLGSAHGAACAPLQPRPDALGVEVVQALRQHPHGLAVVEVGEAHRARGLLPLLLHADAPCAAFTRCVRDVAALTSTLMLTSSSSPSSSVSSSCCCWLSLRCRRWCCRRRLRSAPPPLRRRRQATRTQWWRRRSRATQSTVTSAMNAGDLYASGLISDDHDADMLLWWSGRDGLARGRRPEHDGPVLEDRSPWRPPCLMCGSSKRGQGSPAMVTRISPVCNR
ncbi:unnamed protein product [Urochloa humidicola]